MRLGRLPGRRVAWLGLRGTRWTLTAAAGLGVLVLLVAWVEAGARGSGSLVGGLAHALLALPDQLGRLAPVVAALGAGLAVAGLVRSGEWEGLAAAGLGTGQRLLPLVVVGMAWGGLTFLGELEAAPAATARLARLEPGEGGNAAPPTGSHAWLSREGVVFRVGDPRGDQTGPVTAWSLEGPPGDPRTAPGLSWDGRTWTALGGAPGPWHLLPPPEGWATAGPRSLSWEGLAADGGAGARAEAHARASRAVACGPAAALGGAGPAILGTSSAALLAGLLPVVTVEVLATVVQAAVAEGVLPPAAVTLVRLGGLLLLLGAGAASATRLATGPGGSTRSRPRRRPSRRSPS